MSKKAPSSSPFMSDPQWMDLSLKLYGKLAKCSKATLAAKMHLKDGLLEETHHLYHRFDPSQTRLCALHAYTGLAYRQLEMDAYGPDEHRYLQDHLRILSAMYGRLRPYDLIWPYRLDFTMHLPGLDLKKIWQSRLLEAFASEEILNLASDEFSQLLSPLSEKMHTIAFMDEKNGQLVVNSAEAKKARGRFLDLCVKHKVENLAQAQTLTLEGYTRSSRHCSPSITTHIRNIKAT